MPDRSNNLWWATAGDRRPAPPLRENVRAGIVVIGGGIMGAATALRLAEDGTDVLLIEGGEIGDGASSRPGGFVVPHFSVGSPSEVMARVGEIGRELVDAVGRSAQHVFRRITSLGIECDARQDGWYHPAHGMGAMRRITAIADQWADAGYPGTLLGADQTFMRTGVQGYAGSWLAPSGGTLHPLRYCRGLMDAAIARGCRTFENSAVRSIERGHAGYRVLTSAGSVLADKVIVCTNGLSGDLVPAMTRSIVPLRVWQCATEPLSAAQRAGLFQDGACLSDTRRNLFTYRFDADGRLITGALDMIGVSPQRAASGMSRRLQHFLRLPNPPRITHLWDGVSSLSGSRLPATLVADGGLISGTACNARGIALSTLIGEALAEYALGLRAPPMPVLDTSRPATAGLQSRLSRFYPHLAPLLDWVDMRRARA
jgi:glycine/D-amino acid oxidase-like deaminating enzyme